MSLVIESLRTTTTQWRASNQEHANGVVLIWQSAVYGWKNCLRDAAHERPGAYAAYAAYAVDEVGHVFIAEGGDDYNGAKCWVAVGSEV
jgi:hypothetical protein